MSSLLQAAACADSATAPDARVEPPPVVAGPPTRYTRSDLRPEGRVVDTEDGYMVDGSLAVGATVTLEDANVRVRFDGNGRVTGISGTVSVPSPHERIRFEDPIRAEVGLFPGAFLNAQRDLGILLDDDTDYFVFDFAVALRMNIATGETGANATKPVSIKAPVGRRIVMITDFHDPMYYVYGEHDLIGAAGTGWSANGRIPFVPRHAVAGLGAFSGKTTRTGTFPIFKVLSVTGQIVDNEYTELHLSTENPFDSDLRKGYQAGFNGAMSLDLGIEDVLGVEIPLADASGGILADASMQDLFEGHAYVKGVTSRDDSWWPSFIPARPVTALAAEAMISHDGVFDVGLAGEYGWVLPGGPQTMSGGFRMTNEALTLTGAMRDGEAMFRMTGEITRAATTVSVQPPEELLDRIATDVNAEVLPRIEEAQRAWEDLKQATADYEIELSLRGLRGALPQIADVARKALADGIAAELRRHEGEIYYSSLRSQLKKAAAPYDAALVNLKTQASRIGDNEQTRVAIEKALRELAAKKIFRTTYVYKDPIFGVTLATVKVSRRIMSDAQADRLLEAADNVWRIRETSTVRIRMQQIYDEVDDKAIFEQIRDDIQDGLIVMRDIGELGFVYPHTGSRTYNVFVVIDGRRYEAGALDAMTVEAWAVLLPKLMLEALLAT